MGGGYGVRAAEFESSAAAMTWTLYEGDSAEVLKTIEADSVDLTVTSPPYDALRDYHGFAFDFETIAQELYRVTKPGGVVVWVVGDATIDGSETGTSFKQALRFKSIGFKLHDTMIYRKTGLTFPETNRYYPAFEYMFILSKGKPKTTNLIRDKINIHAADIIKGGSRQPSGELTKRSRDGQKIPERGVRQNVWDYSTGWMVSSLDKVAFEHPAQFPEKLAHDHIISWSNYGDTVLDPFAGSGTTLKMAESLGRNSIGIELSSSYCQIIRRRMANRQTTIFEEGVT